MHLNLHTLSKWLLPIGLVFAALVIVGGTLQWPLGVVYGLTVLMFAAVLGAHAAERRAGRKR